MCLLVLPLVASICRKLAGSSSICLVCIRPLAASSAIQWPKKVASSAIVYELTDPTPGLVATKTPKVRQLRTVKKEILRLIETYIKKAEDLEAVNTNVIPPVLDAILGDYSSNVPSARDAEVLHVTTTITNRLGVSALSQPHTQHLNWISAALDPPSSCHPRCGL